MTLHLTFDMIPDRRIYAGTHNLPPEIIMHIATFLCGYTIHGVGWSQRSPGLELSKKEAGNCSLVCKYWAKTVREGIFAGLFLKTPEDGHQFQSFIERPVSQELSIQRLVKYIHIECNLADPPWLHCVFTFWKPGGNQANHVRPEVLVFNSSDTPSDTPSPRLRSIYQSIPRPPPPHMTVIRTLHLKKVVFADFYDLGKLLASIGDLIQVKLEDILIKDTEKFCVSTSLSHRIHRDLTVDVSGKNIPLQLIRSILPMRYQHEGTTYCIQPHVLLSLEKALFAVTLTRSPNSSGATRSVSKPGDYYLEVNIDEDRPNYCHLYVYHPTFHSILKIVHVKFCKGGTITSMALFVESANVTEYKNFPWGQLDQDLWSLFEEIPVLHVHSRDAESWQFRNLSKVLSREMVNFVRAGKLYVGEDEDMERGSWRVGPPMEGEDEQYENESESESDEEDQYGDESDEEEHQEDTGMEQEWEQQQQQYHEAEWESDEDGDLVQEWEEREEGDGWTEWDEWISWCEWDVLVAWCDEVALM